MSRLQSPRWWRRLVLIGAPLLGLVATIIHPRWDTPSVYGALAPQLELWIDLHVAQLFIFGLLGLALYYWLASLSGRAAQIGRIALACFVVFYPAFDALVGIGTGVMIQSAQQLDPSQLPAAEKLIDLFWNNVNSPSLVGLVPFIGSMGWVGALLAIVVARSNARNRLLAAGAAIVVWLIFGGVLIFSPDLGDYGYVGLLVVLALVMAFVAPPRLLSFWLTIAALAFGFAHVFPAGTIGMVGLLTANVLAEFFPSLGAKRDIVPTATGAVEA